MGNSQSDRSCCQPEVSIHEEAMEDTGKKSSLKLSTKTYERILKRQISPDEAKTHNRDAISKLKQHSLSTTQSEDTDPGERLRRIQEAGQFSKQLRLKVLSSNTLQKTSVVNIGPLGYENSLRGAKDGITYFGSKKRIKTEGHLKGPIINDFIIPQESATLYRGHHFQIRYDPYSNAYFLRDLGEGLGSFVKIEAALPLKDSMLIHIGESFLLANILQRPALKQFPRLRLKLYGGACCGEVFYFNATEYYERKIQIGRANNCEVRVEDTLISKVQACIFFNTHEGWILVDGDMDHQRCSTNGTWLFASDETELTNNLVFKASQTLLQVTLV